MEHVARLNSAVTEPCVSDGLQRLRLRSTGKLDRELVLVAEAEGPAMALRGPTRIQQDRVFGRPPRPPYMLVVATTLPPGASESDYQQAEEWTGEILQSVLDACNASGPVTCTRCQNDACGVQCTHR
ncbi:hypothetical protein ASNO1_20920 [Corallococcus caeni]|uniref:Uncharacterized protein n=1 Tax=Corallococcus caeni TaxID=3082388 RepID=A0ABQ6QPC7_9BACT|nr:hypothetical protein ASNO1_20920 [Corallococcus sp. NO1]